MPGKQEQTPSAYSATPIAELLSSLHSTEPGLSSAEAVTRQSDNASKPLSQTRREWVRATQIFAAQFKSPITLILIGAALLSLFLRDITDASIILVIVVAGALLSFWQEYTAANAVAALLALVSSKATVLRDGREVELPSDTIVSGDIVLLSAGSSIPADCRLLEAKDLFVNESTLTGETYPAEKQPGQVP